jgi:hypothetical protein
MWRTKGRTLVWLADLAQYLFQTQPLQGMKRVGPHYQTSSDLLHDLDLFKDLSLDANLPQSKRGPQATDPPLTRSAFIPSCSL